MKLELKIEYWDINKLIPYARNPRKNDDAVDAVAEAIKEFGFRVPIVAKSDGTVVDGHLRLKAAQKLKTEKVPVVNADDMTEAQIKAFRISVNRMSELAEWDMDLLKLEIEDLKEMDYDIKLTGLSDEMFGEMNEKDGLTDPDEVPEVAEPITKTGDLWLLGSHRLLCGDATKKEDVERLMDGKKADMVFTDPPYGIDYNYNSYEDKREGYFDFMKVVFRLLNGHIKINASIYIKQYTFNIFTFYKILPEFWQFKNLIIWKNNSQAHPLKNYDNAFEPILYFDNEKEQQIETQKSNGDAILFMEKGKSYFNAKAEKKFVEWDGKEKLQIPIKKGKMWNLWDDIKPITGGCVKSKESLSDGQEKAHSCQMPIALPLRSIKFSSEQGYFIVDPFLGSGSTMIACEKTNRICYGMEIDSHYCDIIVKRWENWTGKKAERKL